jgi:hypothetical protein
VRSLTAGLAYSTVSKLWCANISGLLDSGGTITASEILAPRFITTVVNKIGTVSFSPTASYPANIYSWLFSDTVRSPIIKGVRPAWSRGPLSSVSNWVSGFYVSIDSDVSVQPGLIGGATSIGSLIFRQPGKMDGVASAERMMFILTTATTAADWEMTDIWVDIDTAGTS